jgi:hypothetical protein
MLPTIAPGASVTVMRQAFDAVPDGGIVAYARNGRVIVHRAMGRRADGSLLALGDNLPLYDPPVHAAEYLGTVIGVPTDRRPRRPDLSVMGAEPTSHRDVHGHRGEAATAVEVVTSQDPVGLWAQGSDGAVRIAISSAGALHGGALTDLLVAGARRRIGIRVLVGFEFGCAHAAQDGAPVLSPDAAHYHVRLGRPWQTVDACAACALVRASAEAASARMGSGARAEVLHA